VGVAVLVALLSFRSVSANLLVIGPVGGTLATFAVFGTDSAYDPVNHLYLTVGAYGVLRGVCSNTAGNVVVPSFTINTIAPGRFGAHYPRVRYNAASGGFLVTWIQDDMAVLPGETQPRNAVHAAVISCIGPTLISPDQPLSDPALEGASWTTGAAMAYSTISQKFFVVWQTVSYGVKGRLIAANGTPVGPIIPLGNSNGSLHPGVDWNPAVDEFGVSWASWNSNSAFVVFDRVRASDGFVFPKSSFAFNAFGTWHTDISLNSATNSYVMGWSGPHANFANLDAAGNLLNNGLISNRFADLDSFAVRYNPVSGTFLAVGQDQLTYDVAGAELNSGGAPIGNAAGLTCCAGDPGSFYPRLAARSDAANWMIVFSRQYQFMAHQIIGSDTAFGGPPTPSPTPTPTPGPTPTPTPTPAPGACTTPDPFVSIGGGVCSNGGWMPGAPAPTPTPTPTPAPTPTPSAGCTTPDPFVSMGGGTCSNGGWMPGAPAQTPTPTPTPAPTPAPGAGCTTPDPFVSMGGGTCANGGWMPRPASTSGAPAPTPTPAPSGGCSTPDPFVSMGGGTCLNGGWMPGAPSTCTTPDPFVSMGGGVCSNGGWMPRTTVTPPVSTCTTPDPFVSMGGGTCLNGGWMPGVTVVSSCTTPDPFVSMGGGICLNGGWMPKGGRP
jgi:hypothetical protein